jgi:hypothetical protein
VRCNAPEDAKRISDTRVRLTRKSDFLVVTFLADSLVLLLDPSYLKRDKISTPMMLGARKINEEGCRVCESRFKCHKTIVGDFQGDTATARAPHTMMKTRELSSPFP